jgi:hypothetical protein
MKVPEPNLAVDVLQEILVGANFQTIGIVGHFTLASFGWMADFAPFNGVADRLSSR